MSVPNGESVVFVMPDKLGGSTNIVANLLEYRAPDEFSYHAVLTHNWLSTDARFGGRLRVDSQPLVEYRLPVENLYAVMRRLHRALPGGGGVLVTNDLLELAMASAIELDRTVMMMLHGNYDYYYDLAERHQDVIDVFLCYGREMFTQLRARLPHRTESILHLPYGIRVASRVRTPAAGPLRLLFAGRIDHGGKGVFELPLIDRALLEAGTSVTWTIVGDGPDLSALRGRWGHGGARVTWRGVLPNPAVLDAAADHDIFVLPTRNEGFSVALAEAMSVGLVPVASDIPAVREAVTDGVHGFLRPIGDIAKFAGAIRQLDGDRARLETMAQAARERIVRDYEMTRRVRDYQDVFARHRSWRRARPAHVRVPYGSRLDRPWMPNAAVATVRTMLRRMQGRPV